MAFVGSLAQAKERLAKTGGDFEDRPKAKWVSLKDGESVKLVFLQEFDNTSPNFSEKNGGLLINLQHQSPDDWQKQATCTADEGFCYGCQQGWRQKMVLYVNVLVDDNSNEPYVAVWSRALSSKSITQVLLDMAADSDFDCSISDKTFKFSRTGKTKDDTTYSLAPLPKPHGLNVEDYELYDLSQVIFKVNPENQEKYYTGVEPGSAPVEPKAAASSSSVDVDW